MPKFNQTAIGAADNDNPVVYTLKKGGNPVYVGIAQRGRVQERLTEHLGEIPATEFSTRSYDSISEAREAEERKIKREKPKYNDQHK
jgi:predicted GIY-YIG superfamily endonuclease